MYGGGANVCPGGRATGGAGGVPHRVFTMKGASGGPGVGGTGF
jgi:hypothetical protein